MYDREGRLDEYAERSSDTQTYVNNREQLLAVQERYERFKRLIGVPTDFASATSAGTFAAENYLSERIGSLESEFIPVFLYVLDLIGKNSCMMLHSRQVMDDTTNGYPVLTWNRRAAHSLRNALQNIPLHENKFSLQQYYIDNADAYGLSDSEWEASNGFTPGYQDLEIDIFNHYHSIYSLSAENSVEILNSLSMLFGQ